MNIESWDINLNNIFCKENSLVSILEEFFINRNEIVYRSLLNDCFWKNLINNHEDFKKIKIFSLSLDLNKQKYNILEKIVFDLAVYHCKRLNIDPYQDDIDIEYWIKDDDNLSCPILHVDVDPAGPIKGLKEIFPNIDLNFTGKVILSGVVYLTESIHPTVITNVPFEHNDDILLNQNNIFFSFPKPGLHITFNGSEYFHGPCNIYDDKYIINLKKKNNNRKILVLNIWKGKHFHVPKFNDVVNNISLFPKLLFNKQNSIININSNNSAIVNINIDDSYLLSNEFFNDLIKKPKFNLFYKFRNFIKNSYKTNHLFKLYK
jgi:hypothetical protein